MLAKCRRCMLAKCRRCWDVWRRSACKMQGLWGFLGIHACKMQALWGCLEEICLQNAGAVGMFRDTCLQNAGAVGMFGGDMLANCRRCEDLGRGILRAPVCPRACSSSPILMFGHVLKFGYSPCNRVENPHPLNVFFFGGGTLNVTYIFWGDLGGP